MANRTFQNFGHFYAPHTMPVLLDGNFSVGASGAVGTLVGPMISSVTRLSAGVYKIQLQDNYNKFFGMQHWVQAPVTGSAIAGGSFVAGTVYQIVSLGNTTTAQWVTAGVPAGIVPAVGVAFLAAGIGAGTSTVKALGSSGISCIEVVGVSNLQISPSQYLGAAYQGGYVIIKCLGATATADTALIATDPASGSQLGFSLYLSNSSVQVSGE